jgi:hypothetical protein
MLLLLHICPDVLQLLLEPLGLLLQAGQTHTRCVSGTSSTR